MLLYKGSHDGKSPNGFVFEKDSKEHPIEEAKEKRRGNFNF